MKFRDIIVYFHGYGSNSNSDKVDRLRKRFPDAEVYAFDINIDPDLSLMYLESEIDSVLMDNLHVPTRMVFVGTSLGAYYAERMSYLYGTSLYLINPSYDPCHSLYKYGVKPSICKKYTSMILASYAKYYIGTNDEVIDYSPILDKIKSYNVKFVEANHRFNGVEFDGVMDDIAKELYD